MQQELTALAHKGGFWTRASLLKAGFTNPMISEAIRVKLLEAKLNGTFEVAPRARLRITEAEQMVPGDTVMRVVNGQLKPFQVVGQPNGGRVSLVDPEDPNARVEQVNQSDAAEPLPGSPGVPPVPGQPVPPPTIPPVQESRLMQLLGEEGKPWENDEEEEEDKEPEPVAEGIDGGAFRSWQNEFRAAFNAKMSYPENFATLSQLLGHDPNFDGGEVVDVGDGVDNGDMLSPEELQHDIGWCYDVAREAAGDGDEAVCKFFGVPNPQTAGEYGSSQSPVAEGLPKPTPGQNLDEWALQVGQEATLDQFNTALRGCQVNTISDNDSSVIEDVIDDEQGMGAMLENGGIYYLSDLTMGGAAPVGESKTLAERMLSEYGLPEQPPIGPKWNREPEQ